MNKRENKRAQSSPGDGNNDLLIVAIGASAGGIEAITDLLRHLPADTGMAFVLIQHLDPTHHSILTELLGKETAMQVFEVTDGMRVTPNCAYVIPPNTSMTIIDHTLRLAPRGEGRGLHMSIDHFMRTLAEEQGNCAIGVILSGSGSDGTLGIAEIQAQGGVTFAQDASSAKYDSMPRSAIAAGSIDYVLPPKGIARELTRIARHPYITTRPKSEPPALVPEENNGLNSIFRLLRRSTGLDFTHYRQTTILRRVQRRMVVHKIDRLQDYVKYVQTNPAEIKSLYQDMLINVTSFFRNPQMFDALKSQVFPAIVRSGSNDVALRIWTPGCASGEETYSIAIALLEFLGDGAPNVSIQMFGTDVSEAVVTKARAAFYPANIEGDLTPERLRRFFSKADGGYRISKSIRDMCIFAQHNLLNDPPLSQMDLICCRNLLIYLEPVLQSKAISLLHYATRQNGYLVLGTSEGIGPAADLFSLEDRANKIFLRKSVFSKQSVTFSLSGRRDDDHTKDRLPPKRFDTPWNYLELQREFDRRLLAHHAPATLFINEDLEIIHSRGDVSRYLKLAPGRASLSIMKMAREGLVMELKNAISRAKKGNVTVKKTNVHVKIGNGNGNGGSDGEGGENGGGDTAEKMRVVNFEVVPLRIGNLKELYLMILLEEVRVERPLRFRERRLRESESAHRRASNLERELAATKEYLQSVIETHEATNEELQSANEEILSSNEELQSTNEELETAKEELQSTNEELSTVNDELRNRNTEVVQVSNDLSNLLSSLDVAVIMVGKDFTIRRVTPEAQQILGIIPTDIGRPLQNINLTIEISELQLGVSQVMSNERPFERDVQDKRGATYQLRILPYRTSDNETDGAVVILFKNSV